MKTPRSDSLHNCLDDRVRVESREKVPVCIRVKGAFPKAEYARPARAPMRFKVDTNHPPGPHLGLDSLDSFFHFRDDLICHHLLPELLSPVVLSSGVAV